MKYCILTAGLGTRLNVVEGLHKALTPLNNKPAISHILDKMDPDIEVVIALGYKADQVKSYLDFVHKGRKITYVYVDNFEGPGSGPGYSLKCCEPHLQCEFIWTPCDCILTKPYPTEVKKDWIGTSNMFLHNGGYARITSFGTLDTVGKVEYTPENQFHPTAFIGCAGIKDWENFWKIHQDSEVVPTLNKILNLSEYCRQDWYDIGNLEAYQRAKNLAFNKEIVANKFNEVLFIDNNKVVKFFADANRITKHKNRTRFLQPLIPNITFLDTNMMGYNYIPGSMLSNKTSIQSFRDFLDYYKRNLLEVKFDKTNSFQVDCYSMYEAKTKNRVENLAGTYTDEIKIINGVDVRPIQEILSRVNWTKVYELSRPVLFHGDLQPENIICDRRSRKFTLIDWRESFGANLQTGDAYYDLSKLLHGLIINGHMVMKDHYSVVEEDNSAHLEFYLRSHLTEFIIELKTFCKDNNLDWDNVELLCCLHYLNIADLYNSYKDGKYGTFLFLLSKYLLTKKQNGYNLFN